MAKKQMIGDPPKVKTRTVTINPGGYSKTIVKTKTIDTPGKQAKVSTTKTRLTAKGVGSNIASGVRRSVYDFKEAIDKKREQKAANPSPRQQMRAGKREWRKAGRPAFNPEQGAAMKKGGTIKKKK